MYVYFSLMITYSIIYAAVSFAIIVAMIAVVIWKQFELASSSVYFMLGILIGIAGWIIGDFLQIVLSKPGNESLVLIFSQIATISSMVAMVSTVLFARVLSARETLNSKTVAIAFTLFGAVLFMTLAGGYSDTTTDKLWTYTVLPYNSELDFVVTTASLWWTIADAAMVLFAGGTLMWYLIRQRGFVEERHRKIITFMIVGTFFAFIASAIIYALYAINPIIFKTTLHLELVTAAIGASMIGIGMIWGGKQVLYGSSRVYSVHIFDTGGLSLYAGLFAAEYDVNEHLISGVATAISNFAGQLVGKDVIPYEIELGDYALMLEQKDEYIGFIICEFPSAQVRAGLKNIMKDFKPDMGNEDISAIIDGYMPYGEPKVMDIFSEFDE